ncbi:MAG: hypothetical protein A2521_01505 [Deltaproteobacteria bacterium RIFOXYD12_FULL_57_12]|nr:MAG: hypothetical protein A2521_01505 [Deltaproteobacteria bacterium RIFOXYD12_FULL_57_12]
MAADLVLIVAEDSEDARPFEESLQELGLTTRILDYRDNVKEFLPPEGVRGAVLVMRDVNEQGIAKVIKIRSACGKASPLLAAGPNWTRTSVLQAVKYGACDIVVTPATTEEIKGKVGVHLKTAPVS